MIGYAENPESEEEEQYGARRFWQVPQAEAELAFVERVLGELRFLLRQSRELSIQVGLEERIARRISGLKERGIEIKDISQGLVDFYALRNNEVIYLCWKEGEKSIAWWHNLGSGFKDRRPLTIQERNGELGSIVGSGSRVDLPDHR